MIKVINKVPIYEISGRETVVSSDTELTVQSH